MRDRKDDTVGQALGNTKGKMYVLYTSQTALISRDVDTVTEEYEDVEEKESIQDNSDILADQNPTMNK